ncbi:MAG: DUF3566 domain-containing protein [Aeromicrobium sp.]
MSDETPDKGTVPGSPEADDAPTAQFPRLPKRDRTSDATKPHSRSVAESLKNLAASSPEDSSNASDPADAKHAEGRPAPMEPSHPKSPTRAGSSGGPKPRVTAGIGATTGRTHKPAVKVEPGKPKSESTDSRPMTAGEYARTTQASAASTSVIPVIKDERATPPPSPAQAAAASAGRQASLKLVRVDPWSVTKVVFALTVAMMIVAVVAVTILWIVLSFAGVWDQINSSVTTVLSDDSSSFDITEYLGIGRIVGLTLVISAINVVIMTSVATIGAYLYNLAAQLLGGIDITLAEQD